MDEDHISKVFEQSNSSLDLQIVEKPSITYFFPMQSVLPFEKDRSQWFDCLPSGPSHRSGSKLPGRSNMSGLLCRAKWLMPTTVPSGIVSLIAGT